MTSPFATTTHRLLWRLLLAGVGLWALTLMGVSTAQPPEGQQGAALIQLERGAIHTLEVDGLVRLAIGDPAVADVMVVSPSQLLIQARGSGKTSLLAWDKQGEHAWTIEVLDRSPSIREAQLRQILSELNLPSVLVKREADKLFLVGEVEREEEFSRLEQLMTAFPGTTNLVKVLPPPLVPVAMATDLVKLSVQVLEIRRKDLEKLGVDWSDSIGLTEPSVTDLTVHNALTRFGTSVTRTSVQAILSALVEQNKARILAEPKLVTSSGKEASSFVGVEVPIITGTAFGTATSTVSTSVEFRNTGVLLKMTPHVQLVDEERKITTVIEAEVSGLDTSVGLTVPAGSQTVLVPGFTVRRANTEVTTSSGESIFIAGLVSVEDTSNVSQVPALGSMPVLGRLFRTPEDKVVEQEIVIIVTPEIVTSSQITKLGLSANGREGKAVAEVRPTVQDPQLRYAMQVQERIAKAIRYPPNEQQLGITGQVKMRLHLFRDGTLARALIAESSGVPAFDAEALKAAEVQSPYPPFPAELPQQDLWLELPVVFRP